MMWFEVKEFFESLHYDLYGFYKFEGVGLNSYSFRRIDSNDKYIIDIFYNNEIVFTIIFYKNHDDYSMCNIDIICYSFNDKKKYICYAYDGVEDTFRNTSYILDRILESIMNRSM